MPALLFRDEAVAAFDKPVGLTTIPGRRPGEPCLRDLAEAALGTRVFIVHRLDRETSGLVLFALSAAAHRALCGAFEHREVDKRYLAWVAPAPAAAEGRLEQRLAPARRGFMRLARPGEAGPVAITAWRRLAPLAEGALLEVRPETGRTHQIRLQLAEAGCPIVGEPHYHGPGGLPARAAPRLFLHAFRLALRHPVTGAPLTLEAPPPPELAPP